MAGARTGDKGTPVYKVHDADGKYQAACRDAYLAAACVNILGDGATIRHGSGGPVVWREGAETVPAGESFDVVAETVAVRVREHNEATHRRYCVDCSRGLPCRVVGAQS